MTELEKKQDQRIKAMEDAVKEIRDMLVPIADTYKTARIVSRWFWGILVFVSVGLGVLANYGKIFKGFFNK